MSLVSEPDLRPDPRQIIDQLQSRFAGLSPRLRTGARFAIDNPEEIAVHSMRQVAQRAGVNPNVMMRLAREMGHASYDAFRDKFREIITRQPSIWLNRARSLRESGADGPNVQLVAAAVEQEIANLQVTFDEHAASAMSEAVRTISAAESVYIIGLRSLFPVAYYFHYACRMFAQQSRLLTGLGGTFADELRSVTKRDAVVVFSYRPYARDTVKAVTFARSRNARIVAITDSSVSPVQEPGDIAIIVRNTSNSLFPSLVPAVAVAQMLVSLLVRQGDKKTLAALACSQEQLDCFHVYV